VAVIVLFNLTVFAVGLFGIYIVDKYVAPAFSEQSFPQPRLD
jgi:hypothetical protein